MKNIRKVIYALIVLNLVVDAAFLVLARPGRRAFRRERRGGPHRKQVRASMVSRAGARVRPGASVHRETKRRARRRQALEGRCRALGPDGSVLAVRVRGRALQQRLAVRSTRPQRGKRRRPLVAGIAFVICGNIMPKSDRNEAFGLRTPWSLSNDEVWRKSQRFGGYAMIASGVLTVVAGLALPMNLVMPAMVAILLAAAGARASSPRTCTTESTTTSPSDSLQPPARRLAGRSASPVTRKIIAIMRAHPPGRRR